MLIKNLYIIGMLSLAVLVSAGPDDHKEESESEESEIIFSGEHGHAQLSDAKHVRISRECLDELDSEDESFGDRFSEDQGNDTPLLKPVAESSNEKCGIAFTPYGFEGYDGRAVAWREVETVIPESLQGFLEGIRIRPAQTGDRKPESKLIHVSNAGKTAAVHHLTLFMKNDELRKILLNSVRSHYKKMLTLSEVLETFQSRAQEQGCSLKSMKFFFALLTFKNCVAYPFAWNLGFGNQQSVAYGCDSFPICSKERYTCASDCFLINQNTLDWQNLSRLRRTEPRSIEPKKFLERRTNKEVFVQVAYEKIAPHATNLFPPAELCMIQ